MSVLTLEHVDLAGNRRLKAAHALRHFVNALLELQEKVQLGRLLLLLNSHVGLLRMERSGRLGKTLEVRSRDRARLSCCRLCLVHEAVATERLRVLEAQQRLAAITLLVDYLDLRLTHVQSGTVRSS